ncbi:MAG: deoxyribose-phosphate aldolase [Acidimicrobiales bacterium]
MVGSFGGKGWLGNDVRLASVVGFPSGAHTIEVKSFEAAGAVEAGAGELDMVINLGLAMEGRSGEIEREVAAVVAASVEAGAGDGGRRVLVKVIVESALLGPGRTIAACRAAVAAGAGYVKTSTGYHPAGGATVEAVRLMAGAVGGDAGVKAAGGIRTTEQALSLVAAGATRLGASRTASILAGLAGLPAGR